jgi:hypothetical protein
MEAIKITERLLTYLDQNNGLKGQIHSVFDGAFNVVDENNLLIGVLSKLKDLAPFSIQVNVENFNHKKIEQGQEVYFKNHQMVFTNRKLKLQMKQPDVIPLNLNILNDTRGCSEEKLDTMKAYILKYGSKSGIAELVEYIDFEGDMIVLNGKPMLNEYSIFIKERLLEILNLLKQREMESFINYVVKIVGFGPGLTPSADDFLSGIIAVLYIKKMLSPDQLSQIHAVCKCKTTKISEDMIYNTTEGYVSYNSKKLLEAMFDTLNMAIEQEILNVIQIGSTSGTDFLFGVFCMTSLIRKKEA